MKKSWILPFAAAIVGLASCTVSSGTSLTIANAKTYLRDPATTSVTPTKKSDTTYDCSFVIDATKNGLTSDVKGTVSFTATPTEFRTITTGGATHSQVLSPVKNVTGTFAAVSSKGSDGSDNYISCDGTFTLTVTLDEGFEYVSSVAISDFTYTAISGGVQTGA